MVQATEHFTPKQGYTPVVVTLMDAIPVGHLERLTYRFKGVKRVVAVQYLY